MDYVLILTLKDPRNDIMAAVDLTDKGTKIFVQNQEVTFTRESPLNEKEKQSLVTALRENEDIIKIVLNDETLYDNVIGAMK